MTRDDYLVHYEYDRLPRSLFDPARPGATPPGWIEIEPGRIYLPGRLAALRAGNAVDLAKARALRRAGQLAEARTSLADARAFRLFLKC